MGHEADGDGASGRQGVGEVDGKGKGRVAAPSQDSLVYRAVFSGRYTAGIAAFRDPPNRRVSRRGPPDENLGVADRGDG